MTELLPSLPRLSIPALFAGCSKYPFTSDFLFPSGDFFRGKTSQWMANFDAIFDENLQEDEQSSRVSDENVQVTLEPVVIRGVGHMTV